MVEAREVFLPREEVAEEDWPWVLGCVVADEADGGATVGCDVAVPAAGGVGERPADAARPSPGPLSQLRFGSGAAPGEGDDRDEHGGRGGAGAVSRHIRNSPTCDVGRGLFATDWIGPVLIEKSGQLRVQRNLPLHGVAGGRVEQGEAVRLQGQA